MLGQKQAVIQAVMAALPNFVQGQDNALALLTKEQLEVIKAEIGQGMYNSTIEYSKDRTIRSEVFGYARSMVMNHLKKARELNGGIQAQASKATTTQSGVVATSIHGRSSTKTEAPKGVDLALLSDELKEYVKTLV